MDKYYYRYLQLHQNPTNRALHLVGNIFTIWWFCVCVIMQVWWGLLLLPFIVYPFAWIGHYKFEKNKPAAFTNPIKAKLCDWRMCYEIINGDLSIK